MSKENIKEIYYVFKSSINAQQGEVLVFSQEKFDSIGAWKKIDSLKKPLINVGTCIVTDTGKKIIDESGTVSVLPNHKNLILIFDKNNKKFLCPNNAAIYNSDGTLKHQLLLPEEGFWTPDAEGWYIHSTYYADFPNLKGWGVMVTNNHKWPDLCFCLYDGTPNLIWTKYSQERR